MSESANEPQSRPRKGAPKGSVALAASLLLAVGALGTSAAALMVDPSATMALLAAGACVAFASLIAAFVSLRGPRFAPSAVAIVASLCVLAGVGVAFGVVSFSRLVAAVQHQTEGERSVVDEDYRFRLAPPSAESVYDRDASEALHERALAGAYLDDGVMVLVFVEPTYGLPLAGAATASLHDATGATSTWESPAEPTTFLDREAVRIHRQDGEGPSSTFSELTFVERDGWLYCLDAYAERESAPETEVWYPAALEGFTLLDGEVDADAQPYPSPSAEGPGYRVQDGTFESAWWGVRLPAHSQWQLDFAENTPAADQGAIVGLSRRRPDVAITITPIATGGRDARVVEAELVEALAQTATRLEEPPLHQTIGASTVDPHDADFVPWRWEAGRTLEARIGFVTVGERVFEILCWSPSRELTDRELGPLLADLGILSDARMLERRDEIGNPPWRGSGDGWYVRDDTLHLFEEGVSWRRPDPRWRAIPVPIGADELAFLEAPLLGVRGRITAWQALPDPAATHEEWVSGYTEGIEPELVRIEERGTPVTFGELPGHVSTGVDVGTGYVYGIATTQIDDLAYAIELWASPRDAATHAEAIRAALLGFRIAPDASDIGFDEDGVWRDPRFGLSFQPPPSTDTVQRELTTLTTGPGSLLEVARGADIVGLMAAPRDPGASAERQADRLVRTHFGRLLEVEGTWQERDGTLGGVPCTIRDKSLPFGLGGLTIYRVEHEGALVVLLVNRIGSRLDEATVARGVAFDR